MSVSSPPGTGPAAAPGGSKGAPGTPPGLGLPWGSSSAACPSFCTILPPAARTPARWAGPSRANPSPSCPLSATSLSPPLSAAAAASCLRGPAPARRTGPNRSAPLSPQPPRSETRKEAAAGAGGAATSSGTNDAGRRGLTASPRRAAGTAPLEREQGTEETNLPQGTGGRSGVGEDGHGACAEREGCVLRLLERPAGGGTGARLLGAPARRAGACPQRTRERPRGRGEAAVGQHAGAGGGAAHAPWALCKEAAPRGGSRVYFGSAHAPQGAGRRSRAGGSAPARERCVPSHVEAARVAGGRVPVAAAGWVPHGGVRAWKRPLQTLSISQHSWCSVCRCLHTWKGLRGC